jgi:hypothetical protein
MFAMYKALVLGTALWWMDQTICLFAIAALAVGASLGLVAGFRFRSSQIQSLFGD